MVYSYSIAAKTSVPSLVDDKFLSTLPQRDESDIDTSHIAPNITPPTNKWFSGFALQKTPRPGFAFPLSIAPQDGSFSVGLPQVRTAKKTITGAHRPDVSVMVTNAKTYQITRYDELSVDATYKDAQGASTAIVTAGSGSPYVFVKAIIPTTLTIASADMNMSGDTAQYDVDGTRYSIVGSHNAKLTYIHSQLTVTLPANGLITIYALPTGQQDVLKKYAHNRVVKAAVTYKKIGTSYTTSIHYDTENHQPTAYGFMPHQAHKQVNTTLSYGSVYGKISIATGNDFAFETPEIDLLDSLDTTKLSHSNKELLITTLRREINATNFSENDTYYSGKELYRAAQLLQLARQLNEPAIAASIQTKLTNELDAWLSTDNQRKEKLFYYDKAVSGIVGVNASFGSEEFNDHHFHYGYFIYTASILAKYDNTFLATHRSAVNTLVADVANYSAGEKLPLRRSFDPYMSHSWASGSAPFNDGNNQESSSEAMNAWASVQLWGRATGNATLQKEAGWMLSGETAATKAYWLEYDTSEAPYNALYNKSISSLNWGGKRDYSTFFSAEPSAILGIQLLPLSPTFVNYGSNRSRIISNVSEGMPDSAYNVQFSDYILMYRSLADSNGALKIAQNMPDALIDGANSRSYMYAWIMTQ